MTKAAPEVSEKPQKTPGEWAAEGGSYDCTAWVGSQASWVEYQAKNPARWPMYSFERPSTTLWNAIARGLNRQGWTDAEIAEWLASKGPRLALDGELGNAIEAVGDLFARSISKPRAI